MAVIVFIEHLHISNECVCLNLSWVSAESLVVIKCAFALTRYEVVVAIVKVILAVVVVHGRGALIRSFHLCAHICYH
jgi:hypothetical protein